MAPYVVMIFAPYLLSLIVKQREYDENRLARKITVTAFFILFFLLLAFRNEHCGTDMVGYMQKFNNVQYNEWDMKMSLIEEPGYFYLQKLVHCISSDFRVFTVITALLSLLPWWIFYSKETDNAVLSIAIFVAVAPFSMFFSGLRQVLAMAMVVPVWYCVKHKKWLLYALCVFTAFLLHSSAWILAFLLPLYYIPLRKKSLFVVVPAVALVLIFNDPLFKILVRLIGQSEEGMTETGAYMVLVLLIIFTLYAFIMPDESRMDRDTLAMRNILVLTVFIQCFAPVHTLAMRMNYYFLPFIPILIPRIARRARYELERVADISTIVMVVFFTYWFIRVLLSGGSLGTVPYQTWLF